MSCTNDKVRWLIPKRNLFSFWLKVCTTYGSLIKSIEIIINILNWLAAYTVNSSFDHYNAAKCMLRYIKETQNYGITYCDQNTRLIRPPDSNLSPMLPLQMPMITNPFPVMFSCPMCVRSPGCQRSRPWLPYWLQRRNMAWFQKQHLRQHGSIIYMVS